MTSQCQALSPIIAIPVLGTAVIKEMSGLVV